MTVTVTAGGIYTLKDDKGATLLTLYVRDPALSNRLLPFALRLVAGDAAPMFAPRKV